MAVEKLDRLLRRLGKMTPDDIAEYLRSEGITGPRLSSERCPIAVLLNRGREKGPYRYLVSGRHIYRVKSSGAMVKTIIAPNSVADFITNFDHGYYSDLAELA